MNLLQRRAGWIEVVARRLLSVRAPAALPGAWTALAVDPICRFDHRLVGLTEGRTDPVSDRVQPKSATAGWVPVSAPRTPVAQAVPPAVPAGRRLGPADLIRSTWPGPVDARRSHPLPDRAQPGPSVVGRSNLVPAGVIPPGPDPGGDPARAGSPRRRRAVGPPGGSTGWRRAGASVGAGGSGVPSGTGGAGSPFRAGRQEVTRPPAAGRVDGPVGGPGGRVVGRSPAAGEREDVPAPAAGGRVVGPTSGAGGHAVVPPATAEPWLPGPPGHRAAGQAPLAAARRPVPDDPDGAVRLTSGAHPLTEILNANAVAPGPAEPAPAAEQAEPVTMEAVLDALYDRLSFEFLRSYGTLEG